MSCSAFSFGLRWGLNAVRVGVGGQGNLAKAGRPPQWNYLNNAKLPSVPLRLRARQTGTRSPECSSLPTVGSSGTTRKVHRPTNAKITRAAINDTHCFSCSGTCYVCVCVCAPIGTGGVIGRGKRQKHLINFCFVIHSAPSHLGFCFYM